MYKKFILYCVIVLLSFTTYAQTPNMLTDEEKKDGWKLLFDGSSFTGWHSYNKGYPGAEWEIKDGCIHLVDRARPVWGVEKDLITYRDFTNFHLKLEWKIAQNGNSGVMFWVQEDPNKPPFFTGPEMQVLDDFGNSPCTSIPKQRAGELFNVIAASQRTTKPAGEWNQIEIYCKDGFVKFYQNGVNIISTQIGDDNWRNLVTIGYGDKRPLLGVVRMGKIDLQNAGDEVWYRNIKIKEFDDAGQMATQQPSSTNTDNLSSANVTVPAYNTPRMKALAGYYGFLNTPYSDVSKSLEPLVVAGDKMAAMWKAVLLYMGRGQYKHDESQAYNIAKSVVSVIEEKAGKGDAEALYLLFYACQIGIKGQDAISLGNSFLQKSAAAGFIPAVYDNALQVFKNKNYTDALNYFQKLDNEGVKKSAAMIGIMYEEGYGVNKDVAAAIEWYNKGIAFGDAEAILCEADLYATGYEDAPPDAAKAINLATRAAAKNDGDAMLFLGVRYIDSKQGVAKNIPAGIKWLKQAAEIGNRKAMLALGKAYFSENNGIVKDEHAGLFWIKKAAEAGSPDAMLILSKFYNEGVVVDRNEIVARYWYNQCVLAGYAQADATAINATAQTFSDFVNNADFTPSYVLVDEYGDRVGDSGDSFFNGMFGGLFGAMSGYYGNQQRLIDGLEYIRKKGGYKIYGGTVSSYLASNLYLKQGQTIYIKSYGIISTGMFSGMANADGLGNSWQEYAFIQGIPCSAVMAQIKDGTWQFIGQKKSFTATKDGPFVIALNGKDYRNYKGYFDIVVEVPDN